MEKKQNEKQAEDKAVSCYYKMYVDDTTGDEHLSLGWFYDENLADYVITEESLCFDVCNDFVSYILDKDCIWADEFEKGTTMYISKRKYLELLELTIEIDKLRNEMKEVYNKMISTINRWDIKNV